MTEFDKKIVEAAEEAWASEEELASKIRDRSADEEQGEESTPMTLGEAVIEAREGMLLGAMGEGFEEAVDVLLDAAEDLLADREDAETGYGQEIRAWCVRNRDDAILPSGGRWTAQVVLTNCPEILTLRDEQVLAPVVICELSDAES